MLSGVPVRIALSRKNTALGPRPQHNPRLNMVGVMFEINISGMDDDRRSRPTTSDGSSAQGTRSLRRRRRDLLDGVRPRCGGPP
jgi:hypothetical protein